MVTTPLVKVMDLIIKFTEFMILRFMFILLVLCVSQSSWNV